MATGRECVAVLEELVAARKAVDRNCKLAACFDIVHTSVAPLPRLVAAPALDGLRPVFLPQGADQRLSKPLEGTVGHVWLLEGSPSGYMRSNKGQYDMIEYRAMRINPQRAGQCKQNAVLRPHDSRFLIAASLFSVPSFSK